MVNAMEQVRRRRRLNQRIRELIAVRRAVGRTATADAEGPAVTAADDPAVSIAPTSAAA